VYNKTFTKLYKEKHRNTDNANQYIDFNVLHIAHLIERFNRSVIRDRLFMKT